MPVCVDSVFCLVGHAVFAGRLAKLIARRVGWRTRRGTRGMTFVLWLVSTMLVSARPFSLLAVQMQSCVASSLIHCGVVLGIF